jgi:hypothetical protein
MSGKSIAMKEYDYALVEDTTRGEGLNPVVACTCLQRVKGYYGSVDVYMGMPELVATDPVKTLLQGGASPLSLYTTNLSYRGTLGLPQPRIDSKTTFGYDPP